MPTARALVAPVDDNWVARICAELVCDTYDIPRYDRMVAVGLTVGERVSGSVMWWVLSVNTKLVYVPINRMALVCLEGSCNDN
jgi:hypothetical protein